jgi:hypothetical protein
MRTSIMRTSVKYTLSLMLFCCLLMSAQDTGTNLKTIHLFPTLPHEPVVIVRVMRGTAEIKPDVPFQAGDDWLTEISVVVKNVSSSKIVYMGIDAHLPETGAGTREDARVAAGNAVGKLPEPAMYSALTGQRKPETRNLPIDLEPGRELVMPIVSKDDYSYIKQMIEAKEPIASVTRTEVYVDAVYFADGTKWSPAHYYRPDGSAPGKYTVVRYEDWLQTQPVH